MPDYAALAAEGRRLFEARCREDAQDKSCFLAVEVWESWLDEHQAALLTAAERLAEAERRTSELTANWEYYHEHNGKTRLLPCAKCGTTEGMGISSVDRKTAVVCTRCGHHGEPSEVPISFLADFQAICCWNQESAESLLQRCAELAAALDDLIGSAITHCCTGGEDGPCHICDSLDAIDDPASILREHDAALIERIYKAVAAECDWDDRGITTVPTSTLMDIFKGLREQAREGKL